MRKLATSTLGDALASWGAHEASGRGSEHRVDPLSRAACLDFVLWYRARFVARILERQPVETIIVEFDATESGALFLADGRTVKTWVKDVAETGGSSYQHFLKLAASEIALKGLLVAVAKLPDAVSGQLGPIVLFDGWHRAGAWWSRANNDGRSETMQAFLVFTEDEDHYLEFQAV